MRRAVAALVTGALLAACTSDDDAGPGPRPDPTDTTVAVDRSGLFLARVLGETTTTIMEVGTASIAGEVKGPSGLVVGATVRIERLVAGREIRTDVVTGEDGRYLLPAVPGGRYRIRAFLAPTLAQTTPEVRFLTDATEHTVDLAVEKHSGIIVRADAAPKPPLLDQAVNIVATVSNRTVGTDGVVRTTPISGIAVELTGLGRWRLREDGASPSSTTTTTGSTSSTSITTSTSTTTTTSARRPTQSTSARTDSGGRVRWELRCEVAGSPNLSLRVPVTVTPRNDDGTPGEPYETSESFALKLPECVDPATTTTTTTTTAPPPPSTAKP